MIEETLMHVQGRPTPGVPALAPTRYGTGPVTAPTTAITTAPAPSGAGLQGEFELEAEG